MENYAELKIQHASLISIIKDYGFVKGENIDYSEPVRARLRNLSSRVDEIVTKLSAFDDVQTQLSGIDNKLKEFNQSKLPEANDKLVASMDKLRQQIESMRDLTSDVDKSLRDKMTAYIQSGGSKEWEAQFARRARNANIFAWGWLLFAVCFFLSAFGFIGSCVFVIDGCDLKSMENVELAMRASVILLLLAASRWCGRNYVIQRNIHNDNLHRVAVVNSARTFMNTNDAELRNGVYLEMIKLAFAHTDSGYANTGDNNNIHTHVKTA